MADHAACSSMIG